LLINASRHAVVDSMIQSIRGRYAGDLNASPFVRTAQAIRAFFAAIATTAFQ